MKIKNAALRNHELSVPGEGLVKGDENGVFDLPREFAERLLKTKGWSAFRKSAAVPGTPAPSEEEIVAREKQLADEEAARKAAVTPAGEVVRADEEGAQRAAAEAEALQRAAEEEDSEEEDSEEEDSEEEDSEEEEESYPDLEGMTKSELIATAKEYGVDVEAGWNKAAVKEALEVHFTSLED